MAYAHAVRVLGGLTRRAGLFPPGYRSPPTDGDRSLRRRRDGSAVVSVRIRGRAPAEVVADMVDGMLAANNQDPAAAKALRDTLVQETLEQLDVDELVA